MSVYKDRLGGESSCERRLVGEQLFWVTRAISCLGRGRREEASVLMGSRFHSNLGFSFMCQCICIFIFCLVLFGLVKELSAHHNHEGNKSEFQKIGCYSRTSLCHVTFCKILSCAVATARL